MGDNLGPVPLQDFLVDFAAVDQGASPQWLFFGMELGIRWDRVGWEWLIAIVS